MTDDRIAAVIALLVEAEQAHGRYETAELNGVYDQDWPRWYATYAVEQGLGGRVGHDLSADALAEFLASSYDDFAAADPKPTEPWAAYTARRIVAEL